MTPTDALAELRRELRMRQRLYPDWIEKGRIKRADATHRVAALELAIELLEPLVPARLEQTPPEQGSLL
jgi:hypothetical protein